MRRPLWFLVLVPFLAAALRAGARQELDLARELGAPVSDLRERTAELDAEARAEVAAHVGCAPEELAGARVFEGRIAGRDRVFRATHFAAVPLAGPANGAGVVFAADGGRAFEIGLDGALDFDDDPSYRWSAFLLQVRVSGSREAGAEVGPVSLADEGAGELAARARRFGAGGDASALERMLLDQRLCMRRNGMWLAMSRHDSRLAPGWLAPLAAELRRLAPNASALAPLLGAKGVESWQTHARELAGVYEDVERRLAADRAADTAPRATETDELAGRALESCRSCHGASTSDGAKWSDAVGARRKSLGLGATWLRVGLDLAPALGDTEGVSQEIATKVKAGLLLLETLGS